MNVNKKSSLIALSLGVLLSTSSFTLAQDCNNNGLLDSQEVVPQLIDTLSAANQTLGEQFGSETAINDSWVMAGDYSERFNGVTSGVVFAYMNSNSDWHFAQTIVPDDAAELDHFGISVALSESTLLVGAPGNDDDGARSGSAYLFQEVNGVWQQIAKLTASDAEAEDSFGSDVALSGDTAVISSLYDDDDGNLSGSAYIFRNVEGNWQQIAKIKAQDAEAGDQFGTDVAIDENTVIVSARYDDDFGGQSGSLYVFSEIDGLWQQTAKINSDDAVEGDQFGWFVAIEGDTIAAGAVTDGLFERSGAVYLFRAGNGSWQQIAKLQADDPATDDLFGVRIALSGSTLGIGSRIDLDAPQANNSAYLFREVGGVWQQIGKLTGTDPTNNDFLGASISLYHDTAIVLGFQANGQPRKLFAFDIPDSPDCNLNGVPDECDIDDGVSADCNINGVPDTCEIEIGVELDCNTNSIPDACDISELMSTDCNANSIPDECEPDCNQNGVTDECDIQNNTSQDCDADGTPDDCEIDCNANEIADDCDISSGVDPDCNNNDIPDSCDLANDVSEDCDGNLVPDECDDDCNGNLIPDACDISSGYSEDCNNNNVPDECDLPIQFVDQFEIPNETIGAYIGQSVAIDGDLCAVGARSQVFGGNLGVVYLFSRLNNQWSLIATLTSSNRTQYSRFGESLSLSDGTLLIGAQLAGSASPLAGAAYVFVETGNGWEQVAELTAPDAAEFDSFGGSVALDSDTAVIGAHGEDDNGDESGAAYIFRLINNEWIQIAKLTASDSAEGDRFGRTVDIAEGVIIVGADRDDDTAFNTGSAYIFREVGGIWQEVAKLTADEPTQSDMFGTNVAIDGNTAVVSAVFNNGELNGPAYVFQEVNGTWGQVAKITIDDPEARWTGGAMDVNGRFIVLGASYYNLVDGPNVGAAFVYAATDNTWKQVQKIISVRTSRFGDFGKSIAMSEEFLAVGDIEDDERESGSAYLFRLTNANDCNFNGIPDECEPDIDGNGLPDDCTPPCGLLLRGDVNESGAADVEDIALLASILLDPTVAVNDVYCAADVNQDGYVDGRDIEEFVDYIVQP